VMLHMGLKAKVKRITISRPFSERQKPKEHALLDSEVHHIV
jgi:hypothetical protein